MLLAGSEWIEPSQRHLVDWCVCVTSTVVGFFFEVVTQSHNSHQHGDCDRHMLRDDGISFPRGT